MTTTPRTIERGWFRPVWLKTAHYDNGSGRSLCKKHLSGKSPKHENDFAEHLHCKACQTVIDRVRSFGPVLEVFPQPTLLHPDRIHIYSVATMALLCGQPVTAYGNATGELTQDYLNRADPDRAICSFCRKHAEQVLAYYNPETYTPKTPEL